MSTIPIHHSSEHAAGPGADPEPGHREGQLENWSCAQVSDTDGHMRTERESEIQRVKEKPCASSGCALWGERPCPRLLSWRPDNAMLPWEPRDSRNSHMWSCWSQKPQRGIVVIGPL